MKIDKKRGTKNITLLGSSSLLNDIGSEMITPILPFFITAFGGTGLVIGALSGLREGLASLFKIFGGWISDWFGKRRGFVFLGYLISVISRFFLVVASSWQSVLALISIERFGKLRDAPRDAIITQSTKHRGRGFGFHQMMDVLGGIIGTILVIFLFWKFQFDFKIIILIAAIISALSLLPLFFVKEPKIKAIKRGLFQGIAKINPKLKYFIFVASVFTLANFGLYMFLLLRAREITGNLLAPLILYALFNAIFAIFVIPFGRLSDKIGRKKVLLTGYILFFIVSIGLFYMTNLIYLIAIFALYGLVYAITQSNQKALASDLSGEMKGTALGFFHSVTGIVNIPAGIFAGFLWDISYTTMFVYISIIAALSILLLLFVKEKEEYKR